MWDAQICLTKVRASKWAIRPRCGMSNPTKVYSSRVLIDYFPHFHKDFFSFFRGNITILKDYCMPQHPTPLEQRSNKSNKHKQPHFDIIVFYHLIICICDQLYVADYLLYIIILHLFKVSMDGSIHSVQNYRTGGSTSSWWLDQWTYDLAAFDFR
jgi:hypothetical protein